MGRGCFIKTSTFFVFPRHESAEGSLALLGKTGKEMLGATRDCVAPSGKNIVVKDTQGSSLRSG